MNNMETNKKPDANLEIIAKLKCKGRRDSYTRNSGSRTMEPYDLAELNAYNESSRKSTEFINENATLMKSINKSITENKFIERHIAIIYS